ncbi:MAG: type I-B CRISPR-associated protein Cas7/Cst2/DevR [Vicinamibacterales bacterium]
MSLHVFANVVTPFGTAANNRAENEGNITTLQKLIWQGETHSTVSAEAIRFALRRVLGATEATNRTWDEATRANVWEDHQFKNWAKDTGATFIDDDLLGFMTAEAAKEDGSDDGKGSVNVRRAVLEVTRAVSLTPWAGDVTFNAASPGATPSASKGDKNKSKNPVPYGTELHATRYQYGIALTPERLRDKTRAAKAIHALCNLGTVAGNHGRFLFDFSPDAVVIRLTHDPAPRLLYCFDTPDAGKTVRASALLSRIANGDIDPNELIVGMSDLESKLASHLKAKDVQVFGVRKACDEAVTQINAQIKSGA